MKLAFGRPIALTTLAISLGAVAGPIAWRLSGVSRATIAMPSTASEQGLVGAASRVDISSVLASNPFGTALPPEVSASVAGESDLGFTLLGVMLATPTENSRAMVADTTGLVESFAVGAELARGVTITEINTDHIVIAANGSLQRLSFPNAVVEAAPIESVNATPVESGLAALNRLAPSEPNYFIADPAEATDAESVIARYRAAIRQNPLSIMVRLGIEATDRGYRVTETTSQGVLNAGFRPGDIIRSVNGQSVGKIKNDVELFDQVAAAGLAQVELMRDGEEIKLSFPLR